ncbi:MAG TPA: SMP-30/gluconolactonase/LRE family protein, partial [Pseudolabrys sp.]
MNFREVATGLKFPEGPVAMDDGSVIVVEIASKKITRIKKDGKTQTVAKVEGGPNGLAIGPDGALYVCNNGENFTYTKRMGLLIPGHAPKGHKGGWIERVNISTGKSERLYEKCDGEKLMAPNDIVFDEAGGFWFT